MFLSQIVPRKSVTDLVSMVVAGVAVAWGLYSSHSFMYRAGSNSIQIQWDAERNARNTEILVLQNQLRIKEADHAEETQRIKDGLLKAHIDYAQHIAKLQSDYAERLRNSEGRAGVYKRLSESGETERYRLAEHAAKLDRSLEEGRLLVAELRATVKQHERVIVQLGGQILADRKLIEK